MPQVVQSITHISQKIGANRNVTAKYLDILETNGQVESQAFGSARVFFLPRSVPVSTILGLSNDLICTIDNGGCMIFANERFIEFFGLHPGELYHVPVRELPYPYEQWMGLQELLLDPERDKEADRIIRVNKNGVSKYFRKKIIMTRFEDGSTGRILIFFGRYQRTGAPEEPRISRHCHEARCTGAQAPSLPRPIVPYLNISAIRCRNG